jgi:hypothetical protein
MKKLLLLILSIVMLISCNNLSVKENEKNDSTKSKEQSEFNNESKLFSKLKSKFGNPLSSEKYSELYMIYKWESTEDEYGKKIKNEIDKFLNILPYETKTDLGIENKESIITDTYRWETPQIFVEMIHSFGWEVDNKLLSKVSVRIGEK